MERYGWDGLSNHCIPHGLWNDMFVVHGVQDLHVTVWEGPVPHDLDLLVSIDNLQEINILVFAWTRLLDAE